MCVCMCVCVCVCVCVVHYLTCDWRLQYYSNTVTNRPSAIFRKEMFNLVLPPQDKINWAWYWSSKISQFRKLCLVPWRRAQQGFRLSTNFVQLISSFSAPHLPWGFVMSAQKASEIFQCLCSQISVLFAVPDNKFASRLCGQFRKPICCYHLTCSRVDHTRGCFLSELTW